ncbi:hypothetical protein QE370_003283 [Aeromicrobium sp. SORGH_AS981]|uniref:hypothetical protein n=1 Tax=Aeromicrobium sp. SORGH_AS_0981 TaxID=3041802 RepID=UPI0028673ED0|nr:hypothetical protein [Aeromicrobium sp. SORGH_AS_0981]MDR6120099.1 hypothetical protein [Aeromicrobium sp. SORGH_AS_0981]
MTSTRTRRSTIIAAVAACAALVPACSSAATPDRSAVCAAHTGHGAKTVCTKLYAGQRGLRLPTTDADHPWGGVARGGERFVTADGRALPMSSSVINKLSRNHAYATTVYQADVTDGKVTALTPELRVSEDALLQHQFAGRTWIGTISTYSKGSYDGADVPVVVKVDRHAKNGAIGATILNARKTVKVDGRTYRALSKNRHDPLRGGFTARSRIERVPSMHVPFDDELVWLWTSDSSGMGEGYFPSVPTLFGKDPLSRTWEIMQHGTPTSGPALDLRRA